MEWLPTTTKPDRRGRSKSLQTSKPSLILAFFSCVAWLYVAAWLWQDSENRTLLANLLQKNAEQRPKVLTVEDKMVVFGCKDLERRIVEAEMELTMAKSQGFLKRQFRQGGSSEQKLLALIGVCTGFGSRLNRNTFRGSWMPKADSSNSLDHNIDEENRTTKDFLILDSHEEAQAELPKKAKGRLWYEPEWWKFGDQKSYFSHAASNIIILSKNLVQYININSVSLQMYAHDDISVGSWMIDVQATYIDDNRLCCSSIRQDKVCSLA